LAFNIKAASTGAAPAHITKISQYVFNYPTDPGSAKNYLSVFASSIAGDALNQLSNKNFFTNQTFINYEL
jgi:hypothetical protein